MIIKQFLGFLLLSIPFIFVFVVVLIDLGLRSTLTIFGLTALVFLTAFLGTALISGNI